MITIVEPKDHIDRLWGKQKVREADTYRLMRYVLRVDHEDKVLLHNVVTGRLVVLEREEAEALESLPAPYSSVMEQLVTEHYLVPEDYDEHQQVVKLRTILRRTNDVQRTSDIKSYIILTTTACNARCYYCYEKGIETISMTEQTAQNVVRYISDNCRDEKAVSIRWYGGEPTLAAERIDQICEGLRKNGISYSSTITTNGYLFDEKMVSKAKNLWNLEGTMISVDGVGETYNRIKAYVSAKDDPYERVLRNIGLLLDQKITVGLRMNYNEDNYQEFRELIDDVKQRFPNNPFLKVYSHPILSVMPERYIEGNQSWFEQTIVELDRIASDAGVFQREDRLPYLRFEACRATNPNAATITPDGFLVCCQEQLSRDQTIGNVSEGITNKDLVCAWQHTIDYQKCIDCVFYPVCVKVEHCKMKDVCYHKPMRKMSCKRAAVFHYNSVILKEEC